MASCTAALMSTDQLTHGEVKVVLKYRRGLLYNNRLALKWGMAPQWPSLLPVGGGATRVILLS